MIVVAVWWLLAVDARLRATASDINSTNYLLDTLRRQLMQNNYDYEPSSMSGEVTSRHPHTDRGDGDQTTDSGHVSQAYTPTTMGTHDTETQDTAVFVPRAGDDVDTNVAANLQATDSEQLTRTEDWIPNKSPIEGDGLELSKNEVVDDQGISKNDLLFYVDDEKLATGDRTRDVRAAEPLAHSTVKYRLITVRVNNRRSGSVRRFIQEERPGGAVAVLALDGGPPPYFGLPAARRQYMPPGQGDASTLP